MPPQKSINDDDATAKLKDVTGNTPFTYKYVKVYMFSL